MTSETERKALQAILDGFGPNHLSRFCRDLAEEALRAPELIGDQRPTDDDLQKIGRVLHGGRWRVQSFTGLQASEFEAELEELGFAIVPLLSSPPPPSVGDQRPLPSKIALMETLCCRGPCKQPEKCLRGFERNSADAILALLSSPPPPSDGDQRPLPPRVSWEPWMEHFHERVYSAALHCATGNQPKAALIADAALRVALSSPPPPSDTGEEVERLRRDCAELYQVIGTLSERHGALFDDPQVTKALDNASAAANGDPRPHDDLLPFTLSSRTGKT